jgi:hypothetical protein
VEEKRSNKYIIKNLWLEIINILIFLKAALKFRDRRLGMIVRITLERHIKVYIFKQKVWEYVGIHRKGKCLGCGLCCQYIRKCPNLTIENKCAVYEGRHLICRIYPVSENDIQLLLKVFNKKCGFYFV